jgi:type IX secretion system PorP/SprF family membrane protein
VGNRSFQYQYLYFDNQYNGDHYVPDLNSGESFPSSNITYPDVGAGLAYQLQLNERKYFTVGFSMNHLNQPKQSFFGDNGVKLNIRYTLNARARWKVAKKLDVVPEFIFQNQDTKHELAFGVHTKAFVFKQRTAQVCLNTGVYYRNNDAPYFLVGMDYNNWQANVSYDINVSRFNKATSTYGALEISVIYILFKVKNVRSAGSGCPIL